MWALRFAESCTTPGNTETSLKDIQSGKDQSRRGLKEAMAQAVLTKEADLEWRRLSALATAWRIEASERHTKFLHMVLKCEADTYAVPLQNLSIPRFKLLLKAARRNFKTARILMLLHMTVTRRRSLLRTNSLVAWRVMLTSFIGLQKFVQKMASKCLLQTPAVVRIKIVQRPFMNPQRNPLGPTTKTLCEQKRLCFQV